MLLRLIVFFVAGLMIGNQYLVAQVSDEALQEAVYRARNFGMPLAEHPFSSLTVFARDSISPSNPTGVEAGARILTYSLFAEGTFVHSGISLEHALKNRTSFESLVKQIDFAGKHNGHCFLELRVMTSADYCCVLKALQDLGEVAKKFDRFRVDISLSKTARKDNVPHVPEETKGTQQKK